MFSLPPLARSAALSLRLAPDRPAYAAAARAFAAAALIAGFGVLVGDLQAVAVSYLGAACAVAFVSGGPYFHRAVALSAQGVGAAVGICVGALTPPMPAALIAAAAAAGVVSGAAGTIGPNAPGFGMMLSIGVAFGQFGGSSLPWWQQVAWYVAGTGLVALAALAPWLFRRGAIERRAAATMMLAAADLCAATGTVDGRRARARLAATSAVARTTGPQARAQLVAFAAATMYADRETVPEEAVTAIRAAAAQIRACEPVSVRYATTSPSPGLRALADALSPQPQRLPASHVRRFRASLRAALTSTARVNAARIGLCMGMATALTIALHERDHSFWLPLTVAVIVRPEYASVFVRTVNRVCGTLVGASLIALLLSFHPPAVVLALAAAVALGFAVLTAPKLYALSVIGVTASALLSASLIDPDSGLPALRMLDTVIGAAVAVVFGYLVWPGARRLPGVARLDAAVTAATLYLDEAVKEPDERVRLQSRRDDAYRLAHQARAGAQAAMAEPPPVSSFAIKVIPLATQLEDIVDAVTAVAAATDVGQRDDARVADLCHRLSSMLSGLAV